MDCGFVEALDVMLPMMLASDITLTEMMTRQSVADYNLLIEAIHHQHALVPMIYSHFEQAGRGKQLLEYIDPWGGTALDLALEYSYFDIATFLLGKGASYDVYRLQGDHTDDEGKQSTLASVLPRMKAIKFLMALSPPPRLVVTSTGFNVFHILATDENLIGTTVGHVEFRNVLEYFYELDSSLIHAEGGASGLTPFHLVSIHYSHAVGEFLHEKGADVNARSEKGYTPLDVLLFHDAGDRKQEERLTIGGGEGDGPATMGIAICDYALAGPAYWTKETQIARKMFSLYRAWGAKRRDQLDGGEEGLVAEYELLDLL